MTNETNEEEEKAYRYGTRHLIECNCILPQYKKRKNPIFHKFPVFSIIDEEDNVEEKIVACNNCGILHKVTEIGQSTLLPKENVRFLKTIDEIKPNLPEDLVAMLEQNDCDISVWEEAEFIINERLYEKQKDVFILLGSEEVDEMTLGKILRFQGPPLILKPESFRRQNWI
jgi:hypothetical protein